MKNKIIIIISIILLVFGISFIVGKNIIRYQDKEQEVNLNDKKENNRDINKNNEEENNNNEVEEEVEAKKDEEVEANDEEKNDSKVEADTKNDNKDFTNLNTSSNNSSNSTNTDKSNNKTNNDSSTNNNTSNNQTKTLVKTEKVDESNDSHKYGVKITETVTYEVKTYSDGSTEKKKISSKTTYDKSTFNATTNDMKSEATSLVSKNNSIYTELVGYVNNYRSEVNVSNITLDKNLSIAATIRAIEMAYSDKFSHARPNKESNNSCFEVIDELNISWYTIGENIAYNYGKAKDAATQWRNSEGHYNNMINASFGKIGIGMYKLENKVYWVQMFTN